MVTSVAILIEGKSTKKFVIQLNIARLYSLTWCYAAVLWS